MDALPIVNGHSAQHQAEPVDLAASQNGGSDASLPVGAGETHTKMQPDQPVSDPLPVHDKSVAPPCLWSHAMPKLSVSFCKSAFSRANASKEFLCDAAGTIDRSF